MNNINEIYQMLNWHSRYGEQLQGIKLAKELEDISPLILPHANGESKGLWENCARALFEMSDSKLEKHLSSLLEWLQDLNWPGATIILDRLVIFSGEKLEKPFIDTCLYAISLNNEDGLIWLDYLSELLDNKELKILLPKKISNVLQKHYHNWGAWYES